MQRLLPSSPTALLQAAGEPPPRSEAGVGETAPRWMVAEVSTSSGRGEMPWLQLGAGV